MGFLHNHLLYISDRLTQIILIKFIRQTNVCFSLHCANKNWHDFRTLYLEKKKKNLNRLLAEQGSYKIAIKTVLNLSGKYSIVTMKPVIKHF